MNQNPFANVSFQQLGPSPVESVSADDITRVLIGMNPKPLGAVDGGTSEGIARVNANTAETGVVAYRDKKGQAVLTNVARDPITNQEKPIAALFKPTQGEQSTSAQTPTYVGDGENRVGLFDAFKKLQNATSSEEAEAIYGSLLQSVATEVTRLENEAAKFAENKFGVGQMQSSLNAARQADRADPLWTPGMGDSPITQKIINDLVQLNTAASADAKDFLKRNIGYNSLATLKGNAEREYQRIQRQFERKANKDDARATAELTADINRRANQQIRREDRAERAEEESLQIYQRLTPTQIQRINMLNAGEIEAESDERKKQIRIAQLATGATKNKPMFEAISAESNQELLTHALKGNGVAKKLIVMEESMRTGKSAEDVSAMIQSLTTRLADRRMPIEVLNRNTKMGKTEREARMSMLNAAQFDVDPNKKIQVDNIKISLLMEEAQFRIQQQFVSDVSSWGLTDPTMLAAIDKAKKTTSKADIKSVLTAYIGDATDVERGMRLAEFQKALKNAALKQKDSFFGMPNWREAEKIAVQQVVENRWFSGFMRKPESMMSAVGNALATSIPGAGAHLAALTAFGQPLLQKGNEE